MASYDDSICDIYLSSNSPVKIGQRPLRQYLRSLNASILFIIRSSYKHARRSESTKPFDIITSPSGPAVLNTIRCRSLEELSSALEF